MASGAGAREKDADARRDRDERSTTGSAGAPPAEFGDAASEAGAELAHGAFVRRATAEPAHRALDALPDGRREQVVLRLQRDRGNAYVQRLVAAVQRDPDAGAPPADAGTADAAAPDAGFQDAVRRADWPAAAQQLNGLPDADITTQLNNLSHGQRIDLYAAAAATTPRVADTIAQVDLEAAYHGDVKVQDWAKAAVHMNGFNDADIAAKAGELGAADRTAMRLATPEWAFRVRTPLLDLDYQDAVHASDWPHAAEHLNGFNDADITTRLGALSNAQRIELYAGAPTWAQRIYDAIAQVDVDAAFQGAIRLKDWAKAAVHMNGLSDADIATRAAALNPADRTALRLATPEWASRVRAALLDLDYNDALHSNDWAKAAESLNGFDDAGIATRVGALSNAQRIDLYAGAPTWATRIYDAIATADLDAAWQGAVRLKDWAKAAVHLNGFNDADIATRVAALSVADRTALHLATPDWANRVRAAILDLDYNDAVHASNWQKAAEVLNGFNDADIATRLAALNDAQRTQLMAGARENPALGGGDRILAAVRAMSPTAPAAGEVFGTTAFAQAVNSAAAPGGGYNSPVTITFTPNAAVCNAPDIGFVQTLRMVDSGTNNNRDIIPNQKDRLNSNQEAIDRLPGRAYGWYGRNNANGPQTNLTPGSCPPAVNAVMTDVPSWNQPNLTWEFETAVIARSGPQANTVYSVIKWGFTVDGSNILTANAVTKEDRVSAGFGTAADAWNAQAGGPAAGRSTPGQQPLPAFH